MFLGLLTFSPSNNEQFLSFLKVKTNIKPTDMLYFWSVKNANTFRVFEIGSLAKQIWKANPDIPLLTYTLQFILRSSKWRLRWSALKKLHFYHLQRLSMTRNWETDSHPPYSPLHFFLLWIRLSNRIQAKNSVFQSGINGELTGFIPTWHNAFETPHVGGQTISIGKQLSWICDKINWFACWSINICLFMLMEPQLAEWGNIVLW